MAEVAVVTDSVACLPPDLIKKYQVQIVPVMLHYQGQTFRDGMDIAAEEVYSWLNKKHDLPTTSAPPPAAYLEVFRQLPQRNILVITPASQVTAIFDSARVAAEAARSEMPEKTIEVLDSGTAAMGQGFVVLAAAQESARGGGLSQVKAAAQELLPRVHVLAMLDTLYYLVKGGRVPRVVGWASSLIQLKPILQIAQGQVELVARPRTKKRGVERMLSILSERGRGQGRLHLAVLHANSSGEAAALKGLVSDRFKPAELYVASFTPVMGVHTGPGLLGLAFYAEEATS